MTDQSDETQRAKEDGPEGSNTADARDPHKVEKLTKAGRDEIDPDQGSA
jgi:hypothetical protein